MQEWTGSLHTAVAVSMARVAGKLLILQIFCFLYSKASAQLDDVEPVYDFSSSGDTTTDPTLVDYEYGDEDYDYPFPFVPEEVNICRGYPLGI